MIWGPPKFTSHRQRITVKQRKGYAYVVDDKSLMHAVEIDLRAMRVCVPDQKVLLGRAEGEQKLRVLGVWERVEL